MERTYLITPSEGYSIVCTIYSLDIDVGNSKIYTLLIEKALINKYVTNVNLNLLKAMHKKRCIRL